MDGRSTETTVTFSHPFVLTAFDSPLPAGSYRLVTDEERIDGVSFFAYRRVATMLHLPAVSRVGLTTEVVRIDPAEIASALAADARA